MHYVDVPCRFQLRNAFSPEDIEIRNNDTTVIFKDTFITKELRHIPRQDIGTNDESRINFWRGEILCSSFVDENSVSIPEKGLRD